MDDGNYWIMDKTGLETMDKRSAVKPKRKLKKIKEAVDESEGKGYLATPSDENH